MEQLMSYVYSVYEKRSFSEAAKCLFISQPALSAAVARRERELGFRIFDRTTAPISLTPEGEAYIEMIEEILESEQKLSRRLQQLAQGSYGKVSVGGTSYTASQLIPIICGAFRRKYPGIEMHLDFGNVGAVNNLLEKLHHGQLDVHFSYQYEAQTEQATPIYIEQLVIAMHRSIAEKYGLSHLAIGREAFLSRTYTPREELEDLSVFREVPFLYFFKNGSTYRYMEALLGEYRCADCSIKNVRHSGVHYRMMCAGMGALLTTDVAVAAAPAAEGEILFFVPSGTRAQRVLYAVQKKDAASDLVVEHFLAVAKEVGALGTKAFTGQP